MAWCEICRLEQAGDRCAICGGELWQEIVPEEMDPAEPYWSGPNRDFDSLRDWPKGPDGSPEPPVRLINAADFESYGGLTVARLEACGIPVLTRHPENGQLWNIVLGFSSYGIDLYVPEGRLEEAKTLLDTIQEPV